MSTLNRENSAQSLTQNLLSANAAGSRVTIGLHPIEDLRALSASRLLTCPFCEALVVLHAGQIRAPHFAHLPGAVCSLPQSEPETEEHRAGKILLAQWLKEKIPEAEVIVEAHIPATNQRADVLAILPTHPVRRIALEYQCANLTAQEWRRRHRLYREAGVEDLWILGGSRLMREERAGDDTATEKNSETVLRTTDLERGLFWDNAPLLFVDSLGVHLPAGALARFRPTLESQAQRPSGRLLSRPLLSLDFPFALLAWPQTVCPPVPLSEKSARRSESVPSAAPMTEWYLWEWLVNRYRVTAETLAPLFGTPVGGEKAFSCSERLWQALLYYRFIHRRVGDGWWLGEVEVWARTHLPQATPFNISALRKVLSHYQDLLGVAGFLSLPQGYRRENARITADLTTLSALPSPEEIQRLLRYRKTLNRG